MTRPLRLIVVGTGHLGRIHARLARNDDAFELIGIVDASRDSMDTAATEFQVPGFADVDEALARLPAPIDAAIVATPTVCHEDVATRLMTRGIHVLVEKPITEDVGTARGLVDLAERAGITLQVGHVERFNPAVEVAQSNITDPKFIEARRLSQHSFRSMDVGVVHDLMIHDIDLVLSTVQSDIEDVQSFGVSVLGDSEDIAHATLRFKNGCIASLVASRVSLETERRLNVFTPTGFTGVDMQSGVVDSVEIGQPLPLELSWTRIPPEQRSELQERLFQGLMNHHRPKVPEQNAILEEQRDFARCIRQSTIPRVDGRAGLAALEIAEQVLEGIASHQWDGTAVGRIGPFGIKPHDIIRDPRLIPIQTGSIQTGSATRRKAG